MKQLRIVAPDVSNSISFATQAIADGMARDQASTLLAAVILP